MTDWEEVVKLFPLFRGFWLETTCPDSLACSLWERTDGHRRSICEPGPQVVILANISALTINRLMDSFPQLMGFFACVLSACGSA